VWGSVDPWVAYPRSYPSQGGMGVKAASRNAVRSMSRLCLTEGYHYAWIDCLCIDQESSLEKSREILNMGDCYAKAATTLVFPYGLDFVGPPFLQDGSLPRWHTRAWTLQEEALPSSVSYVMAWSEGIGRRSNINLPPCLNRLYRFDLFHQISNDSVASPNELQ
jgi:hypothetical protein